MQVRFTGHKHESRISDAFPQRHRPASRTTPRGAHALIMGLHFVTVCEANCTAERVFFGKIVGTPTCEQMKMTEKNEAACQTRGTVVVKCPRRCDMRGHLRKARGVLLQTATVTICCCAILFFYFTIAG